MKKGLGRRDGESRSSRAELAPPALQGLGQALRPACRTRAFGVGVPKQGALRLNAEGDGSGSPHQSLTWVSRRVTVQPVSARQVGAAN